MKKLITSFDRLKNQLCRALLLVTTVMLGQSAWAADETLFSMSLTATATQSTSGEGSEAVGTIDISSYVNTTKSTALSSYEYYQGQKPSSGVVKYIEYKSGTKLSYLRFTGSSSYLKITLTKALEAGDIIEFSGSDYTIQLGFSTSAPTKAVSSPATSSNKYTVMDNDGICGKSTIYVNRASNSTAGFNTLTITRPDQSKTTSNLAIVKGKSTMTLAPTTTYTLTANTDYTTSSTGAITYESDATGVATVDENGKITAVAAGTANITLSQAEDDTYNSGSVKYTVTVQGATLAEKFGTPTTALDLSSNPASSMTAMIPNGAQITGGEGGHVVFSAYSMVTSFNSEKITWANVPKNGEAVGGSSDIASDGNWAANDVFRGGSAYQQVTSSKGYIGARFATTNNSRDYTAYSLRVKGANKVAALVSSVKTTYTINMAAYEITDGTAAQTTTLLATDNTGSAAVISLDLDATKEYLVTFDNNINQNCRIYEVALYSDNMPSLSSVSVKTAPTKTTYNVGDKFEPAGLVLTENFSDNTTADVAYAAANASDFTFAPTTDTELAETDTKVTITYAGKSVEQTITVAAPATTWTMKGDFDDPTEGSTWAEYEMTVSGTAASYTKHLAASTWYHFGFNYGTSWYAGDEVEANIEKVLTLNGDNLYMQTTYAGDYTFSVDFSTADAPKLTVTYPTPTEITVNRTTAEGSYGTICLPYAATSEGVVLMEMDGKVEKGIQFKYVGEDEETSKNHALEAGVPYLYRATAATQKFVATGTTETAAQTVNGFKGTYTEENISQEVAEANQNTNLFLNTADNMWHPAGNYVHVGAYKCYIPDFAKVDDATETPAGGNGAKAGVIFGVFNGATAVSNVDANVNANNAQNGKYMKNGQLVIVKNGKQYNAAGAQVK